MTLQPIRGRRGSAQRVRRRWRPPVQPRLIPSAFGGARPTRRPALLQERPLRVSEPACRRPSAPPHAARRGSRSPFPRQAAVPRPAERRWWSPWRPRMPERASTRASRASRPRPLNPTELCSPAAEVGTSADRRTPDRPRSRARRSRRTALLSRRPRSAPQCRRPHLRSRPFRASRRSTRDGRASRCAQKASEWKPSFRPSAPSPRR
jgi:hypothetical protein